jgi:DNA-binding MarR family transcriptional regulator
MMPGKELKTREITEVRMTVLLGIIQQLMSTRHNRLFAGQELTLSQFGVLNHFTHDAQRSWTITDLANVMEMNQPGITKIVTVLLKKNLLQSKPDKIDKRKRHLTITHQGLEFSKDTFRSLLPETSHMFVEWNDESLKQFHGHLEKLMLWLDDHRDD